MVDIELLRNMLNGFIGKQEKEIRDLKKEIKQLREQIEQLQDRLDRRG